MLAAFPWFNVYIQHKAVVPLWGSNSEDSPWFLGGETAGLGHSECRGSLHSWERAQCWYRALCHGPPCSCGWCPSISFYPETEAKTKTIIEDPGRGNFAFTG